MQEVRKEIDDSKGVGFMFWTIFYGIGMLWLLAGNSIAPNNILTATWWIVGIIGLIPSFIYAFISTPKRQKNRNCEEAEWYISHYKKIWFAKNPWDELRKFEKMVDMHYDTVNDYRGRKYKRLCNDVWENILNKSYNKPLKDTFLETYSWMSINNPCSEIYEPKYRGVVNNEEKLRAREPSMKTDGLG